MEQRRNFYLVFKEALNNLVKYSGADRASVLITNRNHQVSLLVRDNGVGFDQTNADKIFCPFERSQKKGDLKRINSGLVLCKKIMEKHDGFISARSEIDQGSTFIISFPVA